MTTYLLIPGAGGAAWYWHLVVAELRERGHEAIAVGLPAGDDAAGLTVYADVAVAAAAGHDDLVVVGQSMGGLTAPLVADRIPVRGIVLVNAMIPAPGETGGDWWADVGQDAARRANDIREGRDPEAPFDPAVYFTHDVPEKVLKEAPGGELPQSGTPFEEPWPLAGWPAVPTRVLAGRDDRLFPVELQTRVASERLGLTVELLPGGHLIALSRPAELADALTAPV